jgi:redox-sensitive bicupin YhaK (pirin superfamily)
MSESGKQRRVIKTVTGKPAIDGAGVRLVRVIGNKDVRDFDPFLMLDAFDSANPSDYEKGFPWHPHRGIETVTYLAEGIIEHGDSLGNQGVIRSGGCQWMTAGSGIIHQEMPKRAPRMLGLQLWLNMPAANKMSSPAYHDLPAEIIPVVEENGARVFVIAGEYRGQKGAMRGAYVCATMLSIALEPGAACEVPVASGETAFVYILEGAVSFGDGESAIEQKTAVLLSDGDAVSLRAGSRSPARCVLFSGLPLGEPIAWGGPIVMNTGEELDLAFREIDDGTFIKHGKKA